MTSRLLTPAEIIGITGDEPPLTPADVDAIARRFYNPARTAAVFTGDQARARPSAASGGGIGAFYHCDKAGVWAHTGTPRRAGHIPWRDLEAVLRRNATPSTERALVEPEWKDRMRPYEMWPAPERWHPSYIENDHADPGWPERIAAWTMLRAMLTDAITALEQS